jgi:hypothetical protein
MPPEDGTVLTKDDTAVSDAAKGTGEDTKSKKIDPRQAMTEIMGSPEAYDQAMASGHDIQIPTAKYATTLAPSEHNSFFATELKTDPLGMSSREAKEFVKAEEALIKKQAEEVAAAPSTETVQSLVAAQLEEAGHEPKTAQAMAQQMDAFFETQAKRTGKASGLELFKEYALSIVRKVAGREGGQVFEQPAWHSSRAEFDQFSTDFMGRGEGQQVHGWGLYFHLDKDINTSLYKAKFDREMGPEGIQPGEWEQLKASPLNVTLSVMRDMKPVGNSTVADINVDEMKEALLDDMIERQNQVVTQRIRAIDNAKKVMKVTTDSYFKMPNEITRLIDIKEREAMLLDILKRWKESGNFNWKKARQYEVELDVDQGNVLDLDEALPNWEKPWEPGGGFRELDKQYNELVETIEFAAVEYYNSNLNTYKSLAEVASLPQFAINVSFIRAMEPDQRNYLQQQLLDVFEKMENIPSEDRYPNSYQNQLVHDILNTQIVQDIMVTDELETGRDLYKTLYKAVMYHRDMFSKKPMARAAEAMIAEVDEAYSNKKQSLESLIDEYQAWTKANNLPDVSADEMWSAAMLTAEQERYLTVFEKKWDAAEVAPTAVMPAHEVVSKWLLLHHIRGLKYSGKTDGDAMVIFDPSHIMMKGWEQSARKNPFPESKVQQVVYHGTAHDFKKFSKRSVGKNYGSFSRLGFYFAANPESAEQYAWDVAGIKPGKDWLTGGAYIRPAFINLRNPLMLKSDTFETLEDYLNIDDEYHAMGIHDDIVDQGHDGIVFTASDGDVTYVAFEANQIKSAITFDQDKARGRIIKYGDYDFDIDLMESADLSTFLHESGHFYLEVMKNLAKDSPAVQKDLDILVKWMGVESVDAIGVDQHEQFARGVEAYFMEGKAPSVELRSVFARFRAWLMTLYRKLNNLDVKLSEEVRSVMDRMFATDQEIEAAKREVELRPVFTTAESAGMTPEQFERYTETIQRANSTATEELQQKIISDWQREFKGWWKDQRAIVENEVQTDVLQRPDVAAYRMIRYGVSPDGTALPDDTRVSLDRAGVADIYADDPIVQKQVLDALRKYNLYRNVGGVNPNELAAAMGFKSGDHLIQSLLKAAPYRDVIQAETDKIMAERYGNILIDGTMVDEARAAVMNYERSKLVHSELRALTKKRNEVAPFVQEEKNRQRAAREQGLAMVRGVPDLATFQRLAKARIGSMQVRYVTPNQFLVAARRASQEAVDAATKGDYQTAAFAKQQELFNLELYREAHNARREIDTIVDRSRDLMSLASRKRMQRAGQDYVDQIHEILNRFDFTRIPLAQADRRARLADWLDKKAQDGVEIALDPKIVDEAFRKPYKTLTMDELRGVDDALQHINHMAKLKNRLMKSADKRELGTILDEIETSIRDNAKTKDFQRTGLRLPQDDISRTVSAFFASHRKLSSYARELDGWKDGGSMWSYIVAPINAASDHESTMTHDTGQKLKELFARYTTVAEGVKTRVTTATFGLVERGLYRQEHIPAVNASLSKMEMLMVAMNLGNEDNRTKLKAGYMWNDTQIEAVTDRLTKEDWDFVQGVWDLVESFWPQIKDKEERVNGIAPKRVEPTPIITKHGTYRGGYFPLKYEDRLAPQAYSNRAKEAADRMLRGAYTNATTQHGHTIERIEGVKMPVRLDFGVIFEHLHQVIHDLSFHEHLIDVNKILGSRRVQAAIIETHGDVVLDQIRKTIEDVAAGEIPAVTAWEKSLNWLRHGVSIAAMGWNMTTALLQPLGISQSVSRVGAVWMYKGFSRIVGDAVRMENAAKWVFSQSEFMRNRYVTINREINELRNTLSGQTTMGAIGESFFWLIGRGQMIADLPTWIGAYERYMHEGFHEEKAIALADQAVLDSQGGGQVKDLAQVQRGGPLLKLWTNFYNYFNVTYNLTVESVKKTSFKNPLQIGGLAVDLLLLYTVPAVLGYLLRAAVRGDDIPENEDLYVRLLREQISYIFGTMLGTRELTGLVAGGFGYEGPAGTRFYSELSKLGMQAAQGELDRSAVRAFTQTAGILFHFPAGQVQRTIDGYVALTEGQTENPLALLFGKPKE